MPYTPLTMLPVLPLAAFPPQRAKQIWLALEIMLLVATIVVRARLSRLGILEVAVLGLLAHSGNFQLGQDYILILFLVACGAWCLLRGRERWGGGLFGIACALKERILQQRSAGAGPGLSVDCFLPVIAAVAWDCRLCIAPGSRIRALVNRGSR